MTKSELIHNINTSSLSEFLPLMDIKSISDVSNANNDGYSIGFTAKDFAKKYPRIPVDKVFFSRGFDPTFYFDQQKLVLFPIHLYGRQEMSLSGNLEDEVLNHLKKYESLIAGGDYRCVGQLAPSDRMRIELLDIMAKNRLGDTNNLYDIFVDIYQSSSFGFSGLSREAIDNIFASKTEEQKKATLEALAVMPDKITVYRGVGDKSSPLDKAFSWSLDINTANFFATRLSPDHAAIYTGIIKKECVLEYFDDMNEQEIIVSPEDVSIVDTLNLGGAALVTELISENRELFFKFKDVLLHTVKYNVPDNDDHGKLHALRVLFLALAIGKDACTRDELDAICTAAIWHDCGRGCPGEHGQTGEEFYYDNAWKTDVRIGFLIRWHSMDDELCRVAADNLQISAAEKELRLKMLWVLKDADALDRVRFGIRDLDMNQLRLPVSKELTLVAELARQGLQL